MVAMSTCGAISSVRPLPLPFTYEDNSLPKSKVKRSRSLLYVVSLRLICFNDYSVTRVSVEVQTEICWISNIGIIANNRSELSMTLFILCLP